MNNVLIIGGSYFAGRILVEELIKEKTYQIFVYNRGHVPLRKQGVIELVGDRNDHQQVKSAIPDIEWHAVIDFCAYAPEDITNLLLSIPGKVNHYIFISTTSVYENTWDLPIKEDSPKLSAPQPDLGIAADYGFNKRLAEDELVTACDKKGMPYTILRPAIIYGPYNYAPRESWFFDLLLRNEPIVIPDNELALYSFVYVVDMARIIIQCMGNDIVFSHAFNVSSEEMISYRRIVQVLEKISGKRVRFTQMGIDEINRKEIPLPFPPDSHLLYSGTALQRKLGFEYASFAEGMRSTYQYAEHVRRHRNKMSGQDRN
jgi:nucleoside-diphosphate-sugar epimerase